MRKRLICLLLALVFMLSSIPVSAAAEELNSVYVTIQTGSTDSDGNTRLQHHNVYALEDGTDLLFSAQDLASFCNFTLSFPDSNTITFTRGYKVVSVDVTTSEVSFYTPKNINMKSAESAELPSKVVRKNDQYYLSAAGMLPRLNVTCMLDDGLLTIIPNPLSLWDFIFDVDLSDYTFDIAYCAEVLGCTEKHVKSLVYSNNDLVDSIVYMIDADFADSHEYYEIFDRFIQDETVTDNAVQELGDAYGLAAELAGSYTEVCETMDMVFPDFSHINDAAFSDAVSTTFTVAESAAKFITYCNLFDHDNSKKLEVLDCFINHYAFQHSDAMVTAASQAKMTYENFWLGLMFQGGYSFIYDLTEEITFEGLRESLRVNYLGMLPDNELLERTEHFEALKGAARVVYDKQFDPNSREQVSAWYAHAFLYFYSVEQIYLGMVQHVIDMKGGQLEQVQSFGKTASKMESMYAKYLASSVYLNSDLFDNEFFTAKSSELLASLPYVTRMPSAGNASSAAEYAIFLSALHDSSIDIDRWTIMDIDCDGIEELLIDFSDAYYHTLVLDNWAIDHQTYNTMYCDTTQILQTADGQVFIQYDYNDGESAYTVFRIWDGQHWSDVARWQNWLPDDSDSWSDFFYSDYWEVDGVGVDQDTYNQRVAPFLSATPADFNYMSYDSRSITGDAQALMDDLDTYFQAREGFVKSIPTDVNNDKNTDRIYLLTDASTMWFELMDCDHSGDDHEIHNIRDHTVTLLLAENYGTEIQLRLQRLNLPYTEARAMLKNAKANSNTLTIGDETYYYQEYDTPFSTAPMFATTPADTLVGMTPGEVKSTLKNYEEWIGSGAGCAQGYLGDQLVMVNYASRYGMDDGRDEVLTAYIVPHYPTPLETCSELEPNMDAFTILHTIHPDNTISTNWTAVKMVTDAYGIELCMTSCYYMQYESGNFYKLTLLYPQGDGRVLPSAFSAEFVPLEEVPDSVWSKLSR